MFDFTFGYGLLAFAIGIVVGFLIGLTGVGGGALVLPALIEVLNVSPIVAVGTASLYSSITKIYAVYEHWKLKTIDFASSSSFLMGAAPACIISALTVLSMMKDLGEEEKKAFQVHFKAFVAYVIIFAVIVLIVNFLNNIKKQKKSDREEIGHIGNKVISPTKKLVGVFFGVIIGALVGVSSIGGGSLIIPVLIVFFGLSATQSIGSSILIAVVLTVITSVVYGKGGQVDYPVAIIMSLGSFIGVYYGSRLTKVIPEKKLEIMLILIVLGAAILMLFKT